VPCQWDGRDEHFSDPQQCGMEWRQKGDKGAHRFRDLLSMKSNRYCLGTCEMAAENGAFGGCFRRSFHRNTKDHLIGHPTLPDTRVDAFLCNPY
jgi:hypothetical protein